MPSSGPLSPGTLADDAAFGDLAWDTPGSAASSNNVWTDVDLDAALASTNQSHYLKATNFGFAIPASATITGIVVEVERSAQTASNTIEDDRVRIVKAGAVGATGREDTVTGWPTTDAYKTYGSSSDLWGETWAASDINATTFGMVIAAKAKAGEADTARIDHIRITVHYTTAQTVAVGLNTETDLAQVVAAQHAVTLGLVTETDAALLLTGARVYPLGQASETDLAQAIIHGQVVVMGLAVETDAGFVVVPAHQALVGLVTETDLAQAIAHARRAGVGLVVEVETALGILRYGILPDNRRGLLTGDWHPIGQWRPGGARLHINRRRKF